MRESLRHISRQPSAQLTSSSVKRISNNMQLLNIVSALLLAGSAFAIRAGYDNTYDNSGQSMLTVSCSDGSNGLAARFSTFGSVPTFPNIGGAAAIPGWNSAQCGSCWQLTFQGKSILVTAIDHADDGFNLSQEALDTLTGGRAVEFGAVDVTATQVDKSQCGI